MTQVIRLVWSPGSLAEAATRCSTAKAVLTGAGACALEMLGPFAANIGSMAEPYADLAEYLRCTLIVAPFVFAALFLLWFSLHGLFLAIVASVRIAIKGRVIRRRSTVYARIVLLGPVTILLPGLAWSMFSALKVYAHPWNGFYGPGGKPAWLTSSPVTIFGSDIWVLVGVAVVLANIVFAVRRVGDLLKIPTCGCCAYDLTGNVSGRCPECGHERPPGIDTVCETCGKISRFPPQAEGTVQRCDHCRKYVDVSSTPHTEQ